MFIYCLFFVAPRKLENQLERSRRYLKKYPSEPSHPFAEFNGENLHLLLFHCGLCKVRFT